MNLNSDVKITVVAAAAAAAQTAVTSSVLDMQGFDGVMYIALLGDVTDTAVLTLTANGNSANSTSSPTPVAQKATAAFTADASSADSKVLVIDVARPTLRYQFAVLTRTAANAVVGGIIAIQYAAAKKPTAHDASVIASAFGLGVSA